METETATQTHQVARQTTTKKQKKRPQKIAASQNSSQTGEQVRQRQRGEEKW